MTKNWTGPGTSADSKALDDLFAAVAPTIGDAVTTLMRQGKRLSQIGALFERTFDGKVRGGVGHRTELAKRVMGDHRLPAAALATILENLRSAGADELPIVLLVDRGEGIVAVGIRRERGELISVS